MFYNSKEIIGKYLKLHNKTINMNQNTINFIGS
jgi:hypothetical protein